MREKLKAAIEDFETNSPYLWSPNRTMALDLVLAAARSYACEECGGTGATDRESPYKIARPCQSCKKDREVADGD